MPIYEYQCSECGEHMDLSYTAGQAPANTVCGGCGASTHRVYSAPSIHFIGSGFHNTDYRKSKTPEAKETPTPQETKAKADASKNSTSDKST